MAANNITHIIFDVDGLLLDTETIYTRCISQLCSEYGHEFTWDIKQQMMGRKPREAAKFIIDHLKLPLTVDDYLSWMATHLHKLFPSANLMSGVDPLLKHLNQHSIPMCLATGSDSTEFSLKSQNYIESWRRYFSHFVLSGDDPEVVRGKPDPLIFQVAMRRFASPPSEPSRVLVFEDAPNGVEAALNAGMKVVWVPDPRCDKSLFVDNPDVTCLESLTQFHPPSFGLPCYS